MSVVLVTGGAGFIGSHLVDALLERGERVRALDVLDPLAHPSRERPPHLSAEAELVVADVCDRDALERALYGVDRVFHLAGAVGNGESMVNPRRAVEANCVGTATLLEALLARRDRVRRLVLSSSMVVYGEGAYRCARHGAQTVELRPAEQLRARRWDLVCPVADCGATLEPVAVDERHPLRPTNVYAITKRDQEELVLVLGSARGLETSAVRYMNIYGPRQALGNPYTGVAAIFCARLAAGKRPLVFEDGAQIRDLVHVSDAIAATIAAMDAPGAVGIPINVGSGRTITIKELARALAAAIGSQLEPELTGEFRAGDIRHCFADTALASELLDFATKRSIEDGVAELVEWVRTQTVTDRGDQALAGLRELGLVE